MHTRIKLTLIGLSAALLMATAVGTASAGRLSFSHAELVRASFAAIRYQLLGITGAECPVTLESSFHSRTYSKTVGTLVGYVTRASLGRCITGSATILSETLPWHIQYGGFNEALPRPKPINNVIGLSLRINNALSGSCLARSTATEPIVYISEPTYEAGGNGIIERITVDETKRIECVGIGRGNFKGEGTITESAGVRNELVRLI